MLLIFLDYLALTPEIRYLENMDVKQIENEALALPEPLRAGLVSRLLQTLPPSDLEVSDEEALQRDQDMESGAVAPVSHEEFVRRIEESRGR